jgi:starvation-inducible DNA-binding protein
MSNHTPPVLHERHPTLSDADVQQLGDALQAVLVVLIDLALTGKHAHWNVVGRRFLPVHRFLDELVDAWHAHADEIAERARALGVTPDGRARTIAESSDLTALYAGPQQDDELLVALRDVLTEAVAGIRTRMDALEDVDTVTADLLHGVVSTLEEQRWMLRDMIT